jgi:Cu/Ag efflux protein CusF
MSLPAKFAACAVLALVASCRDGSERSPPSAAARRYTVRGEVVRIAPPGARGVELSIRHEPIPDFTDRSGAVVGMTAMVMPFPVAQGVPLAGVEPGDKVRFRFAMDWERNRMEIEALEELPKETPLDFEAR